MLMETFSKLLDKKVTRDHAKFSINKVFGNGKEARRKKRFKKNPRDVKFFRKTWINRRKETNRASSLRLRPSLIPIYKKLGFFNIGQK